jgi:hypothetical protein
MTLRYLLTIHYQRRKVLTAFGEFYDAHLIAISPDAIIPWPLGG